MTQRMNYEAAAPGGMKALGSVYGYVAQSGLPATLIELGVWSRDEVVRVNLERGRVVCPGLTDRLEGGSPL